MLQAITIAKNMCSSFAFLLYSSASSEICPNGDLEGCRNVLTHERSMYFGILLAMTLAVLVGLVLEYWEISHELRKAVSFCRKERPKEREIRPWKTIMASIGWVLIVLGVGGEFVFEELVNWKDGQLQTINEKMLGDTRDAAGRAEASAYNAAGDAAQAKSDAGEAKTKADAVDKKAKALNTRLDAASSKMDDFDTRIATQGPRSESLTKAAPELIKKLKSFEGQRVSLFVCGREGAQDQEMLDTWGAIAQILSSDKVFGVVGAKWKEVPTNLMFFDRCGAGQGLGAGVGVSVSTDASQRTMEAGRALGDAILNTIPRSIYNGFHLNDPAITRQFIKYGAMAKTEPMAVAALDPDLVIVVIGAHPQQ
jgi:hypothetical protein